MAKLFTLIAALLMAVTMLAKPAPSLVINGDVKQYKYVYIIPASSTTASSGVSTTIRGWLNEYTIGNGTSSANPSESLAGFWMKEGYTMIPSIIPELADKTLIVSYGFLGASADYSTIIIQMTDASTHEVVLSCEASGEGDNDADRVSDALSYAQYMFDYMLHPRVAYHLEDVSCLKVKVRLSNRTPKVLSEALIRLFYYKNDELVYCQDALISTSLAPAYSTIVDIKRDKGFRGYKYRVKVELIDYK